MNNLPLASMTMNASPQTAPLLLESKCSLRTYKARFLFPMRRIFMNNLPLASMTMKASPQTAPLLPESIRSLRTYKARFHFLMRRIFTAKSDYFGKFVKNAGQTLTDLL